MAPSDSRVIGALCIPGALRRFTSEAPTIWPGSAETSLASSKQTPTSRAIERRLRAAPSMALGRHSLRAGSVASRRLRRVILFIERTWYHKCERRSGELKSG